MIKKINRLATYLIFFLITINFILGFQTNIVASDTLYEWFDENPRYDWLTVYPGNYRAMTFPVTTSHNLTSVKLGLYRLGSPGTNCILAIHTTTAGVPTATALAHETFDGNSLPTTSPGYGSGTEIVFSPAVQLTSGNTYAIVMEVPSGDASNKVYWEKSDSDSDYADGDMYWNNTGTWVLSGYNGDFYFYEYGTEDKEEPPGGGGTSGEPTNFTASSVGNNIYLDWDKDEDALTTYIERKTNIGGGGSANGYGFEGYGSDTRGAYNGSATPTIYYVTNLNDDGTGSLKYGMEMSGARVIVFNVSGTIWLNDYITVDNPYLTVAGQTAPSPGICLQGGIWIETHDIIIQHIRIRWGNTGSLGYGNCEWEDCLQIGQSGVTCYNIVIDHCSISWSCDENFGTWYAGHHITWQWNIVSEGFLSHSCGLITSPDMYSTSIHHNLFAHNAERSPFIRGYGNFEIINNVVYNWRDDATNIGAETSAQYGNIVGNYYKQGDDTSSSYGGISVWMSAVSASRYYVHNNIDVEYRPTNSYDDWDLVCCSETKRSNIPLFTQNDNPINTSSAFEAYDAVLNNAGARPLDRDTVDERIVEETQDGTGGQIGSESQVGGYPTLASNTVGCSIPASPHSDYGDGYTNLEHFLWNEAGELLYYSEGETNLSDWERGTGTFIYNGSSNSFEDDDLDYSTTYYYQAWSYNLSGFSPVYAEAYNTTGGSSSWIPTPPLNVEGTYNGGYLNITWTPGYGADTTMIRKESGSYPTSVTDGSLCQNSSLTYYNETYEEDMYYTLWSYNTTLIQFSEETEFTYGGLHINVYNVDTGLNITNWNVTISNSDGSEVYSETNCNNTFTVDINDCPTGTISVIINAQNYSTAVYYMTIIEGVWYTLNAYLSVDYALYYIRIVETITTSSASWDQAVEDAYVEIKRYLNSTGTYTTISTLYTDANGYINLYLTPNINYKVYISKNGYYNTTSDYIPVPPNEFGQTMEKIFRIIKINVSSEPTIENLLESVVIIKYNSTTFKIHYLNLNSNTDMVNFSIYDGDTKIYSDTETSPSNDVTIYFDYTLYNYTNDILRLVVVSTKYNGSINTITKYFNVIQAQHSSSSSSAPIMAIMSIGICLFGLTLTHPKTIFGVVGIIVIIMAIAFTAFADQTWYIHLIQAIELILLMFIFLVFKEEGAHAV
jgi:pectate lyase